MVVGDDAGRVRPEGDVAPVIAGHRAVATVAVRLCLTRRADRDLGDSAPDATSTAWTGAVTAPMPMMVAAMPTQAALRILSGTAPPGLGRATSEAEVRRDSHPLDLSAWRSRMGARIHDFGERKPGFPGCGRLAVPRPYTRSTLRPKQVTLDGSQQPGCIQPIRAGAVVARDRARSVVPLPLRVVRMPLRYANIQPTPIPRRGVSERRDAEPFRGDPRPPLEVLCSTNRPRSPGRGRFVLRRCADTSTQLRG